MKTFLLFAIFGAIVGNTVCMNPEQQEATKIPKKYVRIISNDDLAIDVPIRLLSYSETWKTVLRPPFGEPPKQIKQSKIPYKTISKSA